MDLLPVFRATIEEWRMLFPGDKVVVGVSGGPDSVALLDLLYRLREDKELSLYVAHLHHGLRAEADEEAAMVSELARRYGLPFFLDRVDVKKHAQQNKLSIETAARELRYRFLLEVAGEVGANRIALGHQADDQAETVLLHLLRGTGLSGLRGIPPVRGPFIRPLLRVRRAEIEAYCQWRGLSPCLDLSNWSLEYTRNRIRHQLLPLLAREFNPSIVEVLCRLAEIAREEDEFLEKEAGKAYRELRREAEEGLGLALEPLKTLPLALARRVVRLAYRELVGEELPFEHVEAVRQWLYRPTGKELSLPKNVKVVREYDSLVFLPPQAKPSSVPFYAYPLRVPGITYLPEVGLLLEARLITPQELGDPRKLPSTEALLDWEVLVPPLRVRRRLPGDRFHPFGYPVPVKLKSFLINQKIPRYRRDRLPLVEDAEGIVWVGGVRISARVAVRPETRVGLHLRLYPFSVQENSTGGR
ncbi:tRNA(Ile)-lysidine synthetase [Ammonifex degensii KC4]|uniref:tRNA(Ile)-lysidine synthase n=1 Tax=Ammonifex degensii (strain DSM 10501 / KC4) TaxID=429009 RepID=C9RA09_AMMDK|nr:tRNA lysidine(34) synthetase TilS [Ammonifex degensii]ACX53138.1 tRNA(Ile)-lysidine synthetase [Ammonifex degensii KC4]